MIQQTFRDNNHKQSNDGMKCSFYGRGCGIEPIFEGDEKIRTTNMKFSLKGCVWVEHNTFKSENYYWNLYKKSYQKTFLSMVYCLLQHIQDLKKHPNGTNIGFDPIILD